mmetsp:Transcript_9385/g.11317  ORF Transcript_9385/g.11317 Transcript_9385/m.11317 type:complete len:841 (+) Transcript_9385:48-2570(+)
MSVPSQRLPGEGGFLVSPQQPDSAHVLTPRQWERLERHRQLGSNGQIDGHNQNFDGSGMVTHLQGQCRELQRQLHVSIDAERKAQTQLHQLQLMSKSQTAILRTNLSNKIDEREKLLELALTSLDKRAEDAEVVTSIREQLSKLREAKGANAGSSEAIQQVQQEVEELRKQNADLRGQLDFANDQIKIAKKGQATLAQVNAALTPKTAEHEDKTTPAPTPTDKPEEVKVDENSSHADLARKVSDLENDRKKLIALLFEAKERLKEGPHRTPSPAIGSKPPPLPPSLPSTTSTAADLGIVGLELPPPPIPIDTSKVASLEAEVTTAKAALKKAKSDKKSQKKEYEEKLVALQAEAKESEQQMVSAMEAEVQKVLAEKEAEYEQMRGSDLKMLKKLKKSSAGQTKGLTSLKVSMGGLQSSHKQSRAAISGDLKEFQTMTADVSTAILSKISEQQSSIGALLKNYRREYEERRKLFNLVQELRGNIRVFCRCRPPSAKELERDADSGGAVCVQFPEEGTIRVENDRGNVKQWEFDQMFDFKAQQSAIYQEVSPLVTSVLDGYNACIFAYGQTGSGKTFTMTGPEPGSSMSTPENSGVNTRALGELFERSVKRADEVVDRISVSVLEIYCEQIRDLLSENVGVERLEVRQGDHGNYVPNLTVVPVTHIDQVLELLTFADRNRSKASTNMNEHSSRSHLMLSVNVESTNKASGVSTWGKLHLVDLAGSERIGKSGAVGKALKEAQAINKSLSALGDVIMSRAQKAGHVPFRNSTLTHLLQDSLSGDAKTLMFVCISPVMYNSEETFCSLTFAARVRTVELGKAQKNTSAASGGGSSKKRNSTSGK